MENDLLASCFAVPPDSAKPRVWWHWMNGNITKEGIEKDLLWMKRIGIGGLQNFDGAFDTPQVVEKRLTYMTPDWQDTFRYAVRRAEELGLEFAIASSPGWSETGGPWVEPKDGMKKLVWSETRVRGGEPFDGRLPPPPSVSGPFQHLPATDVITGKSLQAPCFYKDVAVLAYRTPPALLGDAAPISITTRAPSVDASALLKEGNIQPIVLPVSKEEPACVLYEYGTAQRLRAVSLSGPATGSWLTAFTWVIEVSDDGKHFCRVAELPDEYALRHTTVAFPPVVARFARLRISPVPRKTWFQFAANAPGAEIPSRYIEPVRQVTLYTLHFHVSAKVHRFEHKAGFAIAPDYYSLGGGEAGADEVVDSEEIVDLTDRLSVLGELRWTAPPGEWTVLRLGYSLTGKTNHPASPEATGLEVDKLDKRAVKEYLDSYLGKFEKTVGQEWMGKRGIRAFLTDSIESRGQNWTPKLIEEFQSRRGYNPLSWLPALTGVIVGDVARTDGFLWDFRKTLIELIAEAHYGQIAKSVHARSMLYYSESLEGYPTFAMGDDLDMRAAADVPMAAIWTNYNTEERDGIVNHIVDMQGAASVAHVHGKNIVAVEAFTSGYEPWAFSPATLRPVIDLAFALGVNRPVIHTSVHQPIEKAPGMTLGPYGQHFTRHESWAELAGAWVTYLARCSFLMQQGNPVTDVAWFYGEEGSLSGLYDRGAPSDLPQGYGYDFVNATIICHHLDTDNRQLVSSGGARYRLLYLGGTSERMSLAVLRRIKQLADEGVPIAGRRPMGSPSLADERHVDEYESIVETLWGTRKISQAKNPNAALAQLRIAPDFSFSSSNPESSILFRHRISPAADIYFVTNRDTRHASIEARFRVTGKSPQIWHADTGYHEAVSWRVEGEHTIVPLELRAQQSVFVMFRETTAQTAVEVSASRESALMLLDGRWELSFEPHRGAPTGVSSTALASWTESIVPGIKYFSGIGSYRKEFTLDGFNLKPGERVILDLGVVHELAEVSLNGAEVGTAWHLPFRLDITAALKAGPNILEIRVANLWVNRLIGDKQPGADAIAFTVTGTYEATAPLRPSGLIGPVTLSRRM